MGVAIESESNLLHVIWFQTAVQWQDVKDLKYDKPKIVISER